MSDTTETHESEDSDQSNLVDSYNDPDEDTDPALLAADGPVQSRNAKFMAKMRDPASAKCYDCRQTEQPILVFDGLASQPWPQALSLRLTSLNCRGSGAGTAGNELNVTRADRAAKLEALEHLANENDVLFLQETNLAFPQRVHALVSNFLTIYLPVRPGSSVVAQGVAIAIRRAVLWAGTDPVRVIHAAGAHALFVRATLFNGAQIVLGCLHFPTTLQAQLDFLELLNSAPNSSLWLPRAIIGADTNITTGSHEIQDLQVRRQGAHKCAGAFLGWTMQHDLLDLWTLAPRDSNDRLPPTYFTGKHPNRVGRTTIDRILVPRSLSHLLPACSITTTTAPTTSDHTPVSTTLTEPAPASHSSLPLLPPAVDVTLLKPTDINSIVQFYNSCPLPVIDKLSAVFDLGFDLCNRRRRTPRTTPKRVYALERRRDRLSAQAQLPDHAPGRQRSLQRSIRSTEALIAAAQTAPPLAQPRRRAPAQPLRRTDGSIATTTDDIAEAFCEQLHTAAGTRSRAPDEALVAQVLAVLAPDASRQTGLLSPDLTASQIDAALDKCSHDIASGSGIDRVNFAFLRLLPREALCRDLALMWSERADWPSWCLRSLLTPIAKKRATVGCPLLPSDFRFIASMPAVVKVFHQALNTKVQSVLGKIINDEQHGFVPGRQVTDAVAIVCEAANAARRSGNPLGVLMIDFVKAFDAIDRDFIISVLKRFGFSDDFCDAVRLTVLSDKSEYSFQVNGRLSQWVTVRCGVRQGCPFSPTLYGLALSPLFALFRSLGATGFAIPRHLNSQCPGRLSGVAFADDAYALVTSGHELRTVGRALEIFGPVSGQFVSVAKSALVVVVDNAVDSMRASQWPSPADAHTRVLGFMLKSTTLTPDLAHTEMTEMSRLLSTMSSQRLPRNLFDRARMVSRMRARIVYLANLIPFSAFFCSEVDKLIRSTLLFPMPLLYAPSPGHLAVDPLMADRLCGGLTSAGIGTTSSRCATQLSSLARRVSSRSKGDSTCRTLAWLELSAASEWQSYLPRSSLHVLAIPPLSFFNASPDLREAQRQLERKDERKFVSLSTLRNDRFSPFLLSLSALSSAALTTDAFLSLVSRLGVPHLPETPAHILDNVDLLPVAALGVEPAAFDVIAHTAVYHNALIDRHRGPPPPNGLCDDDDARASAIARFGQPGMLRTVEQLMSDAEWSLENRPDVTMARLPKILRHKKGSQRGRRIQPLVPLARFPTTFDFLFHSERGESVSFINNDVRKTISQLGLFQSLRSVVNSQLNVYTLHNATRDFPPRQLVVRAQSDKMTYTFSLVHVVIREPYLVNSVPMIDVQQLLVPVSIGLDFLPDAPPASESIRLEDPIGIATRPRSAPTAVLLSPHTATWCLRDTRRVFRHSINDTIHLLADAAVDLANVDILDADQHAAFPLSQAVESADQPLLSWSRPGPRHYDITWKGNDNLRPLLMLRRLVAAERAQRQIPPAAPRHFNRTPVTDTSSRAVRRSIMCVQNAGIWHNKLHVNCATDPVSRFTWPTDIYSKQLDLNEDCREFVLLLFSGHVRSTAGDPHSHTCVLCGSLGVPRAHFVDGCAALATPTRDLLAIALAHRVPPASLNSAWHWRISLKKSSPKSDLLAVRLAIVAKMAIASVASVFFREHDANLVLQRPSPAIPTAVAAVAQAFELFNSFGLLPD